MTNVTKLLELIQNCESLNEDELQDVDYMLTKLDDWLESELIVDEEYEALQDYYSNLGAN